MTVMPGQPLAATRPARRLLAVLATALTATLVLLCAGVPAARAHDQLAATSPEANTTVPTSPPHVELEFSGPPQELGTQVVVSGPDGAPVTQGPAELRDSTVVQPLVEDLPPGTYTVEWRVTSSDGHPLSGTFPFTVAESQVERAAAAPQQPDAAPAAREAEPVDPGEAVAGQPAGSSSSRPWIAVGAVLVIVVAAGVAVRQLRRRA